VALAQILRFRAMLHVRMPIGSALEPVWRSSARSVIDASGMVGSPWLCPTGAHVFGSGLLHQPPLAWAKIKSLPASRPLDAARDSESGAFTMDDQINLGPEEFTDCQDELWRQNSKGNYCRYNPGSPPDGVIFRRADGVWGGNSSRLGETLFVHGRDDPEEVAELIAQGEMEGRTSNVWMSQSSVWKPNKAGDGEWAWVGGTG
jgi:hypothetical protein